MSEDKKQKLKNEVTAEMEDIRRVMENEQGRRYMYKLLQRSGLDRCSFLFNGKADIVAFNEGGRNQGLQLKDELKQAAPGSYAMMMKENDYGNTT